ncbi:hypothetical protein CTI14_57625, partial [Methylobacterium radiotolerans]
MVLGERARRRGLPRPTTSTPCRVDAAAPGAADAQLCLPGTLDPAKVAGHIVVCDRGGNARAEKSQVVKDAGGIGMVL